MVTFELVQNVVPVVEALPARLTVRRAAAVASGAEVALIATDAFLALARSRQWVALVTDRALGAAVTG